MIDDLARLTPDEVTARLAGSPEERAALIRAGAEAGVAEAQAVYGQMLLDAGQAAEGFGWFVKAARQGHLMALNMVGRCYDLGWGVAVDKARAAEAFRVAATRGLDWAMYNYATLLALGGQTAVVARTGFLAGDFRAFYCAANVASYDGTAIDHDVLLMTLDADGKVVGSQQWGSSDTNDIAAAIAVDACGTAAIVGTHSAGNARDAFLLIAR